MQHAGLGGQTRPAVQPGGQRPGLDRPGGQRPGLDRPGGQRPGEGIASRPNLPDFSQRPTARPGVRPGQVGPGSIAGNPGGLTRPGADGGGIQRPTTRPGQDGGGIQRPTTRPGQDGGGVQRPFPNRPDDRPGFRPDDRPGVRPDTRPGFRPDDPGFRPGNDFDFTQNNISIINYNHWERNHNNVINRSPTIINNGYRPGAAWGGYGYGYQGDWGYGGGWGYGDHFHDDSWCYGAGWRPAYSGYHGGWHHGYCGNDYFGGYDDDYGGFAAGLAAGSLTGWALGSRPYDWGYSDYSNPYYTPSVQQVVVQQPTAPIYDYAQPINTEVPPPAAEVAQPAVSTFDQARMSFQVGDYQQALSLTDQALAKMPNDAVMHEFRALVLFALQRYDEAAAVLYSVLSVGPGWDWTTMAGLYANTDTYTQQLRALENYRSQHPDDAAPAFLLAYHYATAGHKEEAADQYEAVVKLQPGDTLSAGLLSLLRPQPARPATPPQPGVPPTPGAQAAEPTIDPARLSGNWKASPAPNTTISLALQPDGKFTWDVAQGGQSHRIEGTYTMQGDQLALAQAEGGAMVGTVALQGEQGFNFRALGGPASDKGLAFTR